MEKVPENFNGLKVAILGDILHSRVALFQYLLPAKLGAEVMVCGPPTLIPHDIASLGVQVTYNVREALKWCDVANILRIQLERQDIKFFPLREYALYFGEQEIAGRSRKRYHHHAPRADQQRVEITSDVADSGQSIILQQVENGWLQEWRPCICWQAKKSDQIKSTSMLNR